jgi:hypothetical protein
MGLVGVMGERKLCNFPNAKHKSAHAIGVTSNRERDCVQWDATCIRFWARESKINKHSTLLGK